MATLPVTTANDTLSTGSTWQTGAGGSDLHAVLETTDDPVDTTYIRPSVSVTDSCVLSLTNMPSDFESMSTLNVSVRWLTLGRVDDNITMSVRVSDGSGNILAAADAGGTDTTITSNTTQETYVTTEDVSFAYVNTTATKTQWDAAQIRITQTYDVSMANDNGRYRIAALQIEGTYTAVSATNANAECASATGTAETPNASVAPSAGDAASTGTAETPQASVATTAQEASAVGTAETPNVSLFVNAECATATATAEQPTPLLQTTLVPIADISTGTWADTPLYPKLDELPPDDVDFIRSAETPAGDVCEVRLSSGTDPESSANHTVKYRYRVMNKTSSENPSVDLTVELVQGTTVIATRTASDVTSESFADGEFTLTGTEADAITDYTDLRIRLTAAI